MAVVEKTCLVARCDGCGGAPYDEADYHWDSAAEAISFVTDQWNGCGWIQVDNYLFCSACTEYDEEEDEFVPKLSVVKDG